MTDPLLLPPPFAVDDRIYYQHAGSIGVVRRVSLQARRNVFRAFMDLLQPAPAASVLDVGVSLDVASVESNVLEQFYPHPHRLTCAGIGDGAAFQRAFPRVRFVRITPHAPLPFADGQFDLAYSNAVVEHTGSRAHQRAFVAELCRVARRVFVAVPNRLFPLEQHTGLPLINYLPLPAFRALLRRTRFAHWAHEENLNPVFARELRDLFPPGKPVAVRHTGLGLAAFRSNLVAVR